MADRKNFAWVKPGILAVFQVFAVLFVFSGSFPEVRAQGAVANTTTPIIVGGSTQVRVIAAEETTLSMSFEADDPEDASSLRWALESTADLSGGTVEFSGSTRGTSVAVVFRRTVGATVLGSFVLKVMDDLTATTAVVNLMNGFSPQIGDGEASVERLLSREEAAVSLSASDPDTEPDNLIWSIAGTPRELTVGTTVSFVTDTGSSPTARGGTVVLLFERPESSTAGASVVVLVRDQENNTARVVVDFRHGQLLIVGGSMQVRVIAAEETTLSMSFEANDPEDASSLRWALESTADLSGGTVEFSGSTRGTSVAVVFRRTVGATVLGYFVLKVMDDLTATTAVVNLMNVFSPQIVGGVASVDRLFSGEEAAVSLSAFDLDTEPENLIWSIAGTPRELTVGTTVSFVTNTGLSSTASGGTVVLLFERPESSTAGASVVVLVRDSENNTARVVVEFQHVQPPAIAPVVPRLVLPGSGEPQGTWRLEFPVISDEPIDAVTLTVSVGGEWLREDQSSVTVTMLEETEKTSSYLITFSPLSETASGAVSYWLDYADRSGDRGVPVASAKVLTLEHRNGCGVEADGEIFCWGTPFPELDTEGASGLPPPEGGDFVAITSNVVFPRSSNYCAITDTGQADCWGTEYSANPYLPAARYRSVASVFAAGPRGTCAVRNVEIASPGSIVCKRGSPGDSLPVPPPGDFLSVTGGASFNACALDREGKAVCWGSGQAVSNNTPADKRFSSLAIRGGGACGIQIEEDAKPGGALACWGGGYGTIPDERFLNITAKSDLYCGITVEYRMRCWGGADVSGSGDFPAPSAGTTLVAVAMSGAGSGSAGEWACAVGGSGTAECWGDDNTDGRLTGASGRYFGTVISLDPPLITSLRHTGSSGRISFFDVHLDFQGSLYINFVQEGGSTPTTDEVVRRAKAGSLLALRLSFESGGAKTLRLPYLGEGNFRAYFVTENMVSSRVSSTPYWIAAQFSGEEPPLLFADKGALPGSRNIDLYARLGEKFTMEFETASSETRVTPTVWIGGIRIPATLVTVTGQFPTQDDGHNDGSYVVAVETTVAEGVQGAVTYRIEYANQQGVAGVPVFTPQYISGGSGFYCVLLFDGKVKCMGCGSACWAFQVYRRCARADMWHQI